MSNRPVTLFLVTLLICAATLALGTARSAAAQPVRVYVDPPEVVGYTLVPGASFNVSIKLDNVPETPGLGGAQFKLTYDPTLLSVTLLEEVMFHNVTPQSEWENIWKLQHEINNTAGYIWYAYLWYDNDRAVRGGYAPISGNHTMANVVFQVKDISECSLALPVSKLADMNAEPILHDVFGGYFKNNLPPSWPSLMVYVDPPKIENESLKVGSTFDISVKMDSVAAHRGVMGVQFNLTWDPAILEAVRVTEVMFHDVTPPSEWSNIWEIANRINNTGGFLLYAYAFYDLNAAISGGYGPIMGNHTLATIEFRVKGTDNSVLHLAACKAGDLNGDPVPCDTADAVFKYLSHIRGDVNEDGVVDIGDAIIASHAYGSSIGGPDWNPSADLNGDGTVDIYDIIIVASCFGNHT